MGSLFNKSKLSIPLFMEDQVEWLRKVAAVGNTLVRNSLDIYDPVMPNTKGLAIKLDVHTPSYQWHDMLGEITVRGVGATDPNWVTYRGGLRQYQFALNDECWNSFHILHDYVPGSDAAQASGTRNTNAFVNCAAQTEILKQNAMPWWLFIIAQTVRIGRIIQAGCERILLVVGMECIVLVAM